MSKKEQTTFIYCKCGNEMCSDNSFISDTYDDNNNNHVKYKCEKCDGRCGVDVCIKRSKQLQNTSSNNKYMATSSTTPKSE